MTTNVLGAVAVVSFVVAGASIAARADEYRPGFSCPRPDVTDSLAVGICSDPSMTKAELSFEKPYYLRREFDGPAAVPELKTRAAAIDRSTREACRIPIAGSPGQLPSGAASCYITQINKAAKELVSSVFGPSYDEAERDINTHLAAQRKLADLGYLDVSKVDGVYGDDTREAIFAWQRSRAVAATGFLSDLQTRQLLAEVSVPRPVAFINEADKLQRVFTSVMLNVRVPYLETLLGPAAQVTQLTDRREARSYRVSGCAVTAYSLAGVIYGYAVDVSRACKPDLSDILGGLPERSWPMTFNAFASV